MLVRVISWIVLSFPDKKERIHEVTRIDTKQATREKNCFGRSGRDTAVDGTDLNFNSLRAEREKPRMTAVTSLL